MNYKIKKVVAGNELSLIVKLDNDNFACVCFPCEPRPKGNVDIAYFAESFLKFGSHDIKEDWPKELIEKAQYVLDNTDKIFDETADYQDLTDEEKARLKYWRDKSLY